MGVNFANGLLAGVTAAVVWISACMMVGDMESKDVGLWALILLVIGTVGTLVISGVIGKGRTGPRT